MKHKELIVCPWCRNPECDSRIAFEDRTVMETTYRIWFGECECGAHGPHTESPEAAVAAFNSWESSIKAGT